MVKNTLVLGASLNPERYSNMAIKKLVLHKHNVFAVGLKTGNINGVHVLQGQPILPQIHTVTVYLNATNQIPYHNYILQLQPKRIIFNPGAENDELANLASKKGIEVLDACTLVMLSTNQF